MKHSPKKSKTSTTIFKSIDMKDGDITQCWPWTGTLNAKDGRPYYNHRGRRRPAYSVVLELFKNELANKRIARHSCDNPICCNPHHLSWGTKQDNSNDMKERERHGLPKIVVRAIKRLLMKGITHDEIADRFGVSRETVTAINNSLTFQSSGDAIIEDKDNKERDEAK